MSYFIRILSPNVTRVSLETLLSHVPDGKITLVAGTSSNWEQLVLSHTNGTDIALIERNPVGDESLGAEEISEFLDEINESRPDSAATWLVEYIKQVRVIYAFQILSGTEQENGGEILGTLKGARSGIEWVAYSKLTERVSQTRMVIISCGISQTRYPAGGGWVC